MYKYLLIITICIFISCSEESETLSDNARIYLENVIQIMERNSINKHKIDWTGFRTQVFAKAGSAQVFSETYDAIRLALTLLGDNHSFFVAPGGSRIIGERTISCNFEEIIRPNVPGDIGYVKVGGFSFSDPVKRVEFAEQLQDEIKSQDNSEIKGWIVDLRGNTGGNMWPMLAGIGPVLGEGIAGHFIDADDNIESWGYENGASLINNIVVVEVPAPYKLINENPKVAVLLDNGIASSGEAIAVSFESREKTKSFGQPTCGLSTSNRSFNIGSTSLFLTTSYMSDRLKNKYGQAIVPDELTNNEDILARAVDYIYN